MVNLFSPFPTFASSNFLIDGCFESAADKNFQENMLSIILTRFCKNINWNLTNAFTQYYNLELFRGADLLAEKKHLFLTLITCIWIIPA